VASYKAADIPLEVVWSDIDYMERFRDFTVDDARFPHGRMKAFVDK
jgi:alpha-glucosidase (family GH31 glycosyl hydrolase)